MARDPEFQKKITAQNIDGAASSICLGVKDCEGSPHGWLGMHWIKAGIAKAIADGYIIIPLDEVARPNNRLGEIRKG